MRVRNTVFYTVVAMLVVGAALLVGCGSETATTGGDGEQVTITFASGGGDYGDAIKDAWLDPFMAANPNIKVIQDDPSDPSKYKAMVEAGNVTWDVVDLGNDFAIGPTVDLCEKLDPAVVPFEQLQPDKLPTTGYRAPDATIGVVVAYRPKNFSGEMPQTFADFFDLKKYPGKRGCFNWVSGGILEMALLADGVPAEQLYPLDVDRAFKKLDTIKSSIIWWTTGAQSAQLLVDGEVSMGMSWNGRIGAAQAAGATLEIMWPQFILTADYLSIPKGSKHVKEAQQLIAWITSAENNAELSNFINYGPTNIDAVSKINADVAPEIPTSHADTAIGFDDAWWAENYDSVNQQWQNWVQQ